MTGRRIIQDGFGALLLHLCMSLAPHVIPVIGIGLAYFSLAPVLAFGFFYGWRGASVVVLVGSFFLIAFQDLHTLHSFFIVAYNVVPTITLTFAFEHHDKKNSWWHGFYGVGSLCLLCMLIVYALGLGVSYLQGIDLLNVAVKKMLPHKELIAVKIDFIEILFTVFVTSWFLQAISSAILARHVLIKFGYLTKKLKDPWRFSKFWDIPLTGGLVLMILAKWQGFYHVQMLGRVIAFNATLMLGLIGFRILYQLIMQRTQKQMFFWIYLATCFILAWPFIIVVVLGFIQPWYNFTKIPHGKKK